MKIAMNKIKGHRGGFTLIEIIIAIAIVAVLAGAVAPIAFKEMIRAREEATLSELDNLNKALVHFYEDTGRFPSEGEGLAALVTDPGLTGWKGPYVGADRSDPVMEVSTDAFDESYIYDLNPDTNPAGAADLVLASPGSDRLFTFGRLNGTWTLATEGDDLLTLVSAGQVNRDKSLLCGQELQAIAAAAGRYYQDNAAFPIGAGDLVAAYLDVGINNTNYIDPWNTSYVFAQTGGSGSPVVFLVRSFGPDRSNDEGSDDDLTLNVSSVPPGRKASQWKLDIAQTVLNKNGSLELSGDWGSDRSSLGLDGAFGTDGWAQNFEINVGSRTVFSIGPDGNASLTDDNIPKGVGPGSGSDDDDDDDD